MILKTKQFTEVKSEEHLERLKEDNSWKDFVGTKLLADGSLFLGRVDDNSWIASINRGNLTNKGYSEVFEEETSEEEAQGSEAFQRAKEEQKKNSKEVNEEQIYKDKFFQLYGQVAGGMSSIGDLRNSNLAFTYTKSLMEKLKEENLI